MSQQAKQQALEAQDLGKPAERPPMDEARDRLLGRIARQAGHVPADALRNLATAYGILTDKALAEGRITTVTLADGTTESYDAFGNRVAP